KRLYLWGKKTHTREGATYLKKTMGVEISLVPLHRLCNCCGEAVEKQVSQRNISPLSREDHLYVMADGSMIRTRAKEPWKEVKAGRAFKSSDCLKMDEKPSVIRHSQYVGLA
ncbi:MAG: hypothetical protein CRN43_12185, partial [Candidatus Nephrothrix sp. EaCA]